MSGCSKVRFPSKLAACIGLKRRFGKHAAMNVYLCPGCKQWHLGRTRDPYRTVARIDQVLQKHERELKRRLAKQEATLPQGDPS